MQRGDCDSYGGRIANLCRLRRWQSDLSWKIFGVRQRMTATYAMR